MSNNTIANAANVPLNVQQGTIPNMGGALLDWMQQMTFTRVVKTMVGFRVVETPTDVNFWGVIQPLTERQLFLKPEGQRAWTWFQLFAQIEPQGALLTLNVDEIVTWLGKQTRVMARKDYALYSYVEYHLVQDWTGSGPPTP
jgi:hypothetical protein